MRNTSSLQSPYSIPYGTTEDGEYKEAIVAAFAQG
jgi:hypothetical protein